MPESAEEVYARVVALVGEDGRLPVPADVPESEIFPWDGELTTRVLRPPVTEEPARFGEGDQPCWRCAHPEQDVIWRNERWTVASTPQPVGLPVVLFLEPRVHADLLDLDDELASEYGRLSNHLHRILSYLPNVGRVHISKWGDGGAHLHAWFMARTARLPQTRGSSAVEWMDILPPAPEDVWRADLHTVAHKLANHDGEALL